MKSRLLYLKVVCTLMLAVGAAFGDQQSGVIQEAYVTTSAGIRIHYLQTGDRNSNRALVLIPGWRLPAYLWNGQLKKFAPMIRVIAIDPRSQGTSTMTVEDNTPEARARDLHDILARLGVSSPVLVGWSQGSQDVAAYLQQFGSDSVVGVVFVDSPISAGPKEIEVHPQFSKILLSNIAIYESHPREMSAGMVHAIFKQPHPDLDIPAIVNFTLQTPTNTGIAMWVSDIFGVDRRPVLAKLNKPTLVFAAADNPMIDVLKEMAGSIPGAKFIPVEGAAHALFLDQPQVFNDAMQAFLKSLPKTHL